MDVVIKKHKYRKNEVFTAFLFLTPLIIGIALFFIIPISQAIFYSFTTWKGAGEATFIGFRNYVKLFTADKNFLGEMVNTFMFVIGSIPLTLAVSLVFATLINASGKAVGAYRVIYFLPNVTMPAVVAMIWKWLLNSQYGIVDTILFFLLGIRPAWLSDTSLTMVSMCMIAIWSGAGYCIVILIAGLNNIDTSYYEAARTDGANKLQSFFHITLPLMTPMLFFLLITRMIFAFNQFDLAYMLMPSGNRGPIHRSLATVVFGIYDSAFNNFSMGFACAKAVILFIVIMLFTFIQFKGEKRWVYY
jgi:multiple sugar transport system permease protein